MPLVLLLEMGMDERLPSNTVQGGAVRHTSQPKGKIVQGA
jgi:hypothetical protein